MKLKTSLRKQNYLTHKPRDPSPQGPQEEFVKLFNDDGFLNLKIHLT